MTIIPQVFFWCLKNPILNDCQSWFGRLNPKCTRHCPSELPDCLPRSSQNVPKNAAKIRMILAELQQFGEKRSKTFANWREQVAKICSIFVKKSPLLVTLLSIKL